MIAVTQITDFHINPDLGEPDSNKVFCKIITKDEKNVAIAKDFGIRVLVLKRRGKQLLMP